jgi:PST family polysaccharide transporter
MSLAQRSVRSSTFTVFGSGITTIIQFIRSIILARLIAPEIFGVYSFAASFVLITSSLPHFGMSSALLHHAPESEGETALRVHFTISFVLNVFWALTLFLLGWIVFPEDRRWILWIILMTQFFDNLTETSRTILIRRVSLKRIAIIDTTSTLLSTISAVLIAWRGFGILGLISTDIMAAIIAVSGYLIIHPPWKMRFGWSTPIARYLLGFGKRAFLANLVGQSLNYIDNLWTGRFLGATSLGYYSRAYTFSSYPRKILSNPLNSVAAGTYAELKEDNKNLSKAFFRVNALLVRTGFLLAGVLALIAPEFIILVIGRQWLPMLDAFRLMLLYTMLDPIQMTIASLFYAVGKPEKLIWSRLSQLGVLIISLFIFGSIYGIAGVAIAVNLMVLSGICIMLWHAKDYVRFSLLKLFAAPALALFLGLGLARLSITIPGILGSPWRTALIKILVFTFVYLATVIILEGKNIHVLIQMFSQLLPASNPIARKILSVTNSGKKISN